MLLLSAAITCFAQPIIQGDPTEPCGPIRPDYWVGRKTNPASPFVPPLEGRERVGSKTPKHFNSALSDSYNFGANVRVNDNPAGTSYETPYCSGSHAIAARGDTVYLVWRSDRLVPYGGQSTIYFDKSTDGGNTWGTDVRITDSDSAAIMPALALGNDGTIYVSWTDFRHITRQIYFAKSMDGGTTFTPGVHVQPATPDKQQFSSIAVNDSGYIFIAYEDFKNMPTTAIDIYCSRSTDGGNSFEEAVRVDDCPDSVDQWNPDIKAVNNNVYILWRDFREDTTRLRATLHFSRSITSGNIFSPSILLSDSGHWVGAESITADSIYIYICWGVSGDIYMTKSADSGNLFIKPIKNIIDASGQPFIQGYPSIACDDSGGVYCAWEDTRNYVNSARQIYFGYSKDYGDSFSLNYHLDDRGDEDSAWLFKPTICANKKGEIFSAWQDGRNKIGGVNYDIYATGGYFTGIEGQPPSSSNAKAYCLKAYPNPFKGVVTIECQMPTKGAADISIYNITGQLIKRLESGQMIDGKCRVTWNGTDNAGNKIKGGIYLVCMKADGKTKISKTTYIR